MKATATAEPMTEARPSPVAMPSDSEPAEVCFIAFPVATFRAISDEATKRGQTFAQFLAAAIDAYVLTPVTPRLLTEKKRGA